MIECLALVHEIDYPDLAPLCVRSVVGDDYAAFLEYAEQHRQNRRAIHVTTIDVYIDPKGLKAWLNGRVATRTDLSRYATGLVKP